MSKKLVEDKLNRAFKVNGRLKSGNASSIKPEMLAYTTLLVSGWFFYAKLI
jgi:hypothetical protein